MYVIISVPSSDNEVFAHWADDRLSRDLDWKLALVDNAEPHPHRHREPSMRASLISTILSSPYFFMRSSVPQYNLVPWELHSTLSNSVIWVYHLNALNLMEDVTKVIDTMHTFGCFILLTPYCPTSSDPLA